MNHKVSSFILLSSLLEKRGESSVQKVSLSDSSGGSVLKRKFYEIFALFYYLITIKKTIIKLHFIIIGLEI